MENTVECTKCKDTLANFICGYVGALTIHSARVALCALAHMEAVDVVLAAVWCTGPAGDGGGPTTDGTRVGSSSGGCVCGGGGCIRGGG